MSEALGIQHAKVIRRFILSSVACLSLPYFPAISHKRHDIGGKKVLFNIKCVLILSTNLSEAFVIVRRTEQNIIINVHRSSRNTMGTVSFPGVKRPGRGADHPSPSKRRGHERVELYLYSPSGPSWPVIG